MICPVFNFMLVTVVSAPIDCDGKTTLNTPCIILLDLFPTMVVPNEGIQEKNIPL